MRNLKDRLLINTDYQETRPSEITHPLVDPASTHAIPMQISFFFLSKSRISQLVKMYENEKSMILSTLMLPSKNTRVAEASMFIVVYCNVFKNLVHSLSSPRFAEPLCKTTSFVLEVITINVPLYY